MKGIRDSGAKTEGPEDVSATNLEYCIDVMKRSPGIGGKEAAKRRGEAR